MTDQQLSLFDYTALDTETRIVVQQRTGEIKALMRTTAQGIIDIGEKLTEVKQRLGHGNFGTWLHLEFSWTDRTARQFMRVYDQFKMENFSDLTIAPSALYLLAAPSTPDEVREHFIEQSQNGISVGYTEVKELKQAFDIAPDPIKKRLLEGDIAPQTAAERVLHYVKRLCSLKLACQLVEEEYAERKPAHENVRREKPQKLVVR